MRIGCCFFLIASAFVLSPAASAQETTWYIGVSAGSVSWDVSPETLQTLNRNAMSDAGLNVVTDGDSRIDDSDTVLALFAGYRLNRIFSFEIGYIDLGEVAYEYSGQAGRIGGTMIPPPPVVLSSASTSLTLDTRGVSVKSVARAPLGAHFDIHAHAGALFASSERTMYGQAGYLALKMGNSEKESAVEPFFGLGAAYQFGNKWTMSLDYQRFRSAGVDNADADLDAFTLGLQFGW